MNQIIRTQILVLPLLGCVTMGELHSLSVPQLPHLVNEGKGEMSSCQQTQRELSALSLSAETFA